MVRLQLHPWHCENCGAPMETIVSSHYVKCVYCGSIFLAKGEGSRARMSGQQVRKPATDERAERWRQRMLTTEQAGSTWSDGYYSKHRSVKYAYVPPPRNPLPGFKAFLLVVVLSFALGMFILVSAVGSLRQGALTLGMLYLLVALSLIARSMVRLREFINAWTDISIEDEE